MLVFRALLAVAMILCGIVILARMLATIAAGFAVIPGGGRRGSGIAISAGIRGVLDGGIGYFFPPAMLLITPRTYGLSLEKSF